MDKLQVEQAVQQRLNMLTKHLNTVRQNYEQVMVENKRLREVVRLAEAELRKRREQIEALKHEQQNAENKRLDAKARVEDTIEKLDVLIAENEVQQP
ncbi:MAG: hypothetical protein Q9N67_05120 [Ghiorsea sp.]|nr:hypothetical protein [Ghiorsea sp.]